MRVVVDKLNQPSGVAVRGNTLYVFALDKVLRFDDIATNPGDLVLDSFLGSGTTAAVAHKMGRRWIGIEMGDHAVTHCAPRLNKVIAGEGGGISRAVDWQGGRAGGRGRSTAGATR